MKSMFIFQTVTALTLSLWRPSSGTFLQDKNGDLATDLRDFMETLIRNRRAIQWTNATGKTSFTQEEMKEIVDMHNSCRSVVKPTASDMIELEWDMGLANFTQTFLNQCTGNHNQKRNYGQWQDMGENMYYILASSYSHQQAIQMWFDERKHYDISDGSCTHKQVCGHYLALAWATSHKIGCAVKQCNKYTYFLCNYSGTVWSGGKPYKVGAACSSCPATHPVCRHNLCVTQKMFDSNVGFDGNTSTIDSSLDNTSTATRPGFLLMLLIVVNLM